MTKYFTALLLVICVMSCAQSGVGVYKPPVGNASLPAGVTACGNALPAEDDQVLTFDADLNCAKWKSPTGGEGGALDFTVKEVDNNPTVETVDSLGFDQADGFVVSSLGGGAARVDLVLTDAHIPNDVTIDSATSAGTADTALDLECTNCVGDGELASTFSKFSFSTIDTPSGTDPVADSATDTVTLTASGGLSITGNSTNDSIAFGLTLTDAEIPNDVTIDNATTADSLGDNGTNCPAGQAAGGVDASGNAEDCFTPEGGGGGSVTVQESDASPSVSDTTTISFDQSQGFTVSDEGSGEAEVGLALDATQINYADNDDVYPTDNVGAAIEALRASNGIGPNQTTGKVNWEQIVNMPEDFLDGEIDALAETPIPCEGQIAIGVQSNGDAICVNNAPAASSVSFVNADTVFTGVTVQEVLGEVSDALPPNVSMIGSDGVDVVPTYDDSEPPVLESLEFVLNFASHGVGDDVVMEAGEWVPTPNGLLFEGTSADNDEYEVLSPLANPDDETYFMALWDDAAEQLVANNGSGEIVVGTYAKSDCKTIENIAAADDNMPLSSWPYAVTITGVWCQYAGSAPSAAATFTLEDGDGNAMTITGSNPTCTGPGTEPTPAAVTAANALVAYEMLRFDTTNTPDPETDTYMICVSYTTTRQ